MAVEPMGTIVTYSDTETDVTNYKISESMDIGEDGTTSPAIKTVYVGYDGKIGCSKIKSITLRHGKDARHDQTFTGEQIKNLKMNETETGWFNSMIFEVA